MQQCCKYFFVEKSASPLLCFETDFKFAGEISNKNTYLNQNQNENLLLNNYFFEKSTSSQKVLKLILNMLLKLLGKQ
jgi:hypothetical protein